MKTRSTTIKAGTQPPRQLFISTVTRRSFRGATAAAFDLCVPFDESSEALPRYLSLLTGKSMLGPEQRARTRRVRRVAP